MNYLTAFDAALTVSQLAERTGFKEETIRCWINRKNNSLPAVNPGIRQTRIIWSQFIQ
jgi:excisionase family DNA binding protein